MARAHFRDAITGVGSASHLDVVAGATVHVYTTGTTTHITQTIYAASTGATALTNPLTAGAGGLIEFWLDTDQRVDLAVTATGYASQTLTVDVVDTLDDGPVNASDRGALGDGSHDDTAAIQAAIDALPAAGGVVILPPGVCKITSTLTIGNGTSVIFSTKKHVTLRGAGAGETNAEISAPTAGTSLAWFGALGGTVLKLQGPISACVLEDFAIDCLPTGATDAAGTGLLIEHAQQCEFNRLTIHRFSGVGVDLTAYATHAAASDGCNDNLFRSVNVQWPTGTAATCLRVGADAYGASPHLDPARNLFLGCTFRCVNLSGNAGTAIHLRFTDAITFVSCETAGTAYIEVTVPTGSGGDVFPSSITFLHCFLIGGAPVINGTWVGTQPIELLNVHTGDGWTIPAGNIFRGYTNTGTVFDNKTGVFEMRAGTGLSPELRLDRNGTDSIGLLSDAAGRLTIWDYNAAAAALVVLAGALIPKASATGGAGFRLTHGTAPTSPVDGDMWTTTAGLFVRVNGVTKSVNLT